MAEWDHFKIYEKGKVIINESTKLDVVELSSGRYFLDKELFKKNPQDNPIYVLVGHYINNENEGITSIVTNKERLSKVIQEIEENLIKG
ncbi:MAG: hypothetical protein ACP5NZ_02800 [Nanobdellota archaeon]